MSMRQVSQLIPSCRPIPIAGVLVIAGLLLAGRTAAAELPNRACPVLRDRLAVEECHATYKGEKIYFCCNECVKEFNRHPEVYESQIPQLQRLDWRAQLDWFFDTHTRIVSCLVLAVVLLGLLAYRCTRPQKSVPSHSLISRLLTKKVSATVPLTIAVMLLGSEVYALRQERFTRDTEEIMHFATFYDFGYPPLPAKPPVEPRLAATFYRGNDERSPRLFNEGNYCTAAFHISVCDQDGVQLDPLDEIGDRQLFLQLVIDRPPFTPDFLYEPEIMEAIFLTQQCDRFLGRDQPVSDRVDLETVEEMQKWQATFPLAANGEGQYRGIVYVCEDYFFKPFWWSWKEQRCGARFHYGIQYELEVQDGRLTQASDIWMGALYRTRKFPKWKLPLTQWFSHEPIPELPSENIDDPELLGISDHADS